ncbi:LRR receptor-like serine/threonine-protein kinase RPK2 [Senna tora]|uniref:LRR receptor-like serine/threonine-protein kinase RPK2 n=1 Tax=Senna tora TaxID=362788 RepID=A0A834WE52_9FABA|nr:LRR receptor-like serine/threonine-protein kinase RPK2 [Senna tora]
MTTAFSLPHQIVGHLCTPCQFHLSARFFFAWAFLFSLVPQKEETSKAPLPGQNYKMSFTAAGPATFCNSTMQVAEVPTTSPLALLPTKQERIAQKNDLLLDVSVNYARNTRVMKVDPKPPVPIRVISNINPRRTQRATEAEVTTAIITVFSFSCLCRFRTSRGTGRKAGGVEYRSGQECRRPCDSWRKDYPPPRMKSKGAAYITAFILKTWKYARYIIVADIELSTLSEQESLQPLGNLPPRFALGAHRICKLGSNNTCGGILPTKALNSPLKLFTKFISARVLRSSDKSVNTSTDNCWQLASSFGILWLAAVKSGEVQGKNSAGESLVAGDAVPVAMVTGRVVTPAREKVRRVRRDRILESEKGQCVTRNRSTESFGVMNGEEK